MPAMRRGVRRHGAGTMPASPIMSGRVVPIEGVPGVAGPPVSVTPVPGAEPEGRRSSLGTVPEVVVVVSGARAGSPVRQEQSAHGNSNVEDTTRTRNDRMPGDLHRSFRGARAASARQWELTNSTASAMTRSPSGP